MAHLPPVGGRFFRKTISLPVGLQDWVLSQASAHLHAGNVSSYIRSLVQDDKARRSIELSLASATPEADRGVTGGGQ